MIFTLECIFYRLVLFSCLIEGWIDKLVCQEFLDIALPIKGRDRCRLLILKMLFYIAAVFLDERTGHTWSNSITQGCFSRSLANLPTPAELWL